MTCQPRTKTPIGTAWRVALAALGCTLAVAAHPADAPSGETAVDTRLDALFGEHDSYHAFLKALQTALAAHARQTVASMVSYPLTAKVHGRVLHLHTPRDFLAYYDELLPVKTQELIAHQSYGQLFANSQGVMIGDGQVWFGGVCEGQSCVVKIIAFNPPP
jgi:hypothetical protein